MKCVVVCVLLLCYAGKPKPVSLCCWSICIPFSCSARQFHKKIYWDDIFNGLKSVCVYDQERLEVSQTTSPAYFIILTRATEASAVRDTRLRRRRRIVETVRHGPNAEARPELSRPARPSDQKVPAASLEGRSRVRGGGFRGRRRFSGLHERRRAAGFDSRRAAQRKKLREEQRVAILHDSRCGANMLVSRCGCKCGWFVSKCVNEWANQNLEQCSEGWRFSMRQKIGKWTSFLISLFTGF